MTQPEQFNTPTQPLSSGSNFPGAGQVAPAQAGFPIEQNNPAPFGMQAQPQQASYPQAGYPAAGYPGAGAAAQSFVNVQVGGVDRNGLGTAGFVVGLVAAIFSIIPIIGLIAWVLAPVGAILSGVGMTREPKGLAISGLVLSLIALIICIAWVSAFS